MRLSKDGCLRKESDFKVQIHLKIMKMALGLTLSIFTHCDQMAFLNMYSILPLMLLRNINPRQGLCNGTRLIFEKCIENKLLKCRILETSREVLIPRITFIPKPSEYPFEWQRRQFPVRPAFAITINKSQGQTLKFAGVWLRGEVFAHGQLYVACSRVSHPDNLRFALKRDPPRAECIATNIVYKEVLLNPI